MAVQSVKKEFLLGNQNHFGPSGSKAKCYILLEKLSEVHTPLAINARDLLPRSQIDSALT